MIPLGARIAARLDNGVTIQGVVKASWDGGMLVEQDHDCQHRECPKRALATVRERQLTIRMATIT